jgi:hypothetical protein
VLPVGAVVATPVHDPKGSEILFELDWMPNHALLVRAYAEPFGKLPCSADGESQPLNVS